MFDLEILKEQNNLTVSDDGLIYVQPNENGGWKTYPLEELAGCLALTPEEYVLLKAGYYEFNPELNGLQVREIVQVEDVDEELEELEEIEEGE